MAELSLDGFKPTTEQKQIAKVRKNFTLASYTISVKVQTRVNQAFDKANVLHKIISHSGELPNSVYVTVEVLHGTVKMDELAKLQKSNLVNVIRVFTEFKKLFLEVEV